VCCQVVPVWIKSGGSLQVSIFRYSFAAVSYLLVIKSESSTFAVSVGLVVDDIVCTSTSVCHTVNGYRLRHPGMV
jgi:hypothetical protein